jgi:hypothetical protein
MKTLISCMEYPPNGARPKPVDAKPWAICTQWTLPA